MARIRLVPERLRHERRRPLIERERAALRVIYVLTREHATPSIRFGTPRSEKATLANHPTLGQSHRRVVGSGRFMPKKRAQSRREIRVSMLRRKSRKPTNQ